MATIQGTGGNCSIVDVNMKFVSFTGKTIGEAFDTTGFGDAGWQTGKIITGQVVGTAIGIIDDASAPLANGFYSATCGVGTMEGEIVLTTDTGKTLTFDALLTAVSIDRAETGAGSSAVRVDFQSSGAVVQAWV